MKSNLFSSKLKNTAGSRLENVDTVMLENECNKKEIVGKKTIKSSEEEGMDDRHFVVKRAEPQSGSERFLDSFPRIGYADSETNVHVLESFMKKDNYPVIVKIHHKRSPFINNELRAYEHLRDFQNCVKKICDFSCLDDKERWKSPIKRPVEFCNNKTDELHFIVLEYIENGNIENRIKKMKTFSELASLILQIELMILELGCNYHMLHGDLHSGNILISDIENRRIHYTIDKREYRISSYGIIPLFIDFGRSKISKEAIPIEFVLEDVYMTIQIILRYIPDDNIIQKIHDFIHTQSVTNTDNPHKLILDTKTFFTSLGKTHK